MRTLRNCEFPSGRNGRVGQRTMEYLLVLLIVWVAPAVLLLLVAVWFLFIKGGKLPRRAKGPPKPGDLSSSEES
jgi:hypothetical protein